MQIEERELTTAPVSKLIFWFQSGLVSATQLIEAHLNQVDLVNPKINAVTHLFREKALEQAWQSDLALKTGRPHLPLLGIPFSVKGSFAIQDCPWEVGSPRRKNLIAKKTAVAVELFNKKGAIPLCHTNVPEALTWIETENKIYGRTNNPYDLGKTSGGSSGGEAALIASGGSPFGIGSDLGGSIRIPAAFCGITGHKPTSGLTRNEGQWPISHGILNHYNVTGLLARCATDLPFLLEILSEKRFRKETVSDDLASLKKTMKVYFYVENGEVEASFEVKKALRVAVSHLKDLGFEVQEWLPEPLSSSFLIWIVAVANAEGPSFSEILAGGLPGQKIPLMRETLYWALENGTPKALRTLWAYKGLSEKSKHLFPILGQLWLEKTIKLLPKNWLHSFRKKAQELEAQLTDKLGNHSVLIAPVYPTEAPRHHVPKRNVKDWAYSGVYNIVGVPATSVPVSKSEKTGMPLSIQVIANRGNDHLTLQLASLLEKVIRPF